VRLFGEIGLIAWRAGVRKIETTSRRQPDRAQNESNPQTAE
jgi:hypothetical protein